MRNFLHIGLIKQAVLQLMAEASPVGFSSFNLLDGVYSGKVVVASLLIDDCKGHNFLHIIAKIISSKILHYL